MCLPSGPETKEIVFYPIPTEYESEASASRLSFLTYSTVFSVGLVRRSKQNSQQAETLSSLKFDMVVEYG